ncbi:nucleotidyltransferase domain-containing protein [Candidatus Pacearchaeota archaeon]|nr:nucleotidyltransferase domain-containing protein [Candidatus Pacearchaeota archaeon]
MHLKKAFARINRVVHHEYGPTLAAIIVFGSANTGDYKPGISDIDLMVFLKEGRGVDYEEEKRRLFTLLKDEHASLTYLMSLADLREKMKTRGSWSSYITLVAKDGSTTLSTSPAFERIRAKLKKSVPSLESIITYLDEKDQTELDGFSKSKGFNRTKLLYSHMRRKLQIMYFIEMHKLRFDYHFCLNHANLPIDEKRYLRGLYLAYSRRRLLTRTEEQRYLALARAYTMRIKGKE